MRLTFHCAGHQFTLTRSEGLEHLFVDDKPVSLRAASSLESEHCFSVGDDNWQAKLLWQPQQRSLHYQMQLNGQRAGEGQVLCSEPFEPEQPVIPPQEPTEQSRHGKGLGWLALALKLFKSASAVKVALAGASFASYAYLFDWKIALALIAILVIHEYGHLLAMKRFGVKTKGIYLIPFVGGAAVSAEQFKSQWQELYVALAGPSAGLASTLLAYGAWQFTQNPWLGAVTALGAFLNLVNLLPIHPLDGGRVLKAVMASTGNKLAFYGLLLVSALGFALSLYFGLVLLAILLVAGLLDLMGERNQPTRQLPMNRWGMVVGGAWYSAVLLALLALVWAMADSGLPGTQIPHLLLSS